METIKISDLAIGDWVQANGAAKRVHSIEYQNGEYFVHFSDPDTNSEDYMHAPFVDPIPITPEILEANGLFRHEVDADNPKRVVMSNSCMLARTYEDVDWWRVLIYDEEELSVQLFNGIVYSVHQLQHALRLAGVEKEIEMPKK